jgi:hypothetical protein
VKWWNTLPPRLRLHLTIILSLLIGDGVGWLLFLQSGAIASSPVEFRVGLLGVSSLLVYWHILRRAD